MSEIVRQKEIIAQIREMHKDQTVYALVDTYGCQQNALDSEILSGMLSEMGYIMTEDYNLADVIILNSCAIREHAEMRVMGNVGALVNVRRKNDRGQIIGICGCMTQQEHVVEKIRKKFKHIDIVFGTHTLHKFPEILLKRMLTGERVFEIVESDGEIFEGLPVLRESNEKASVCIMYGCNNFCAYCVVPYVRGRERSRDVQNILDEITGLVKDGYKEIMLLGQNVNSYRFGEVDFPRLLELINDIEGDFILRFMTSHPKDATRHLFDTIHKLPKVAKQIHLPVQSGNNRILKLMNRHYTREHYIELVDYARSLMPEIDLTSDIIVGFPTETEEEFEDTLDLVRKIKFNSIFTFIFSPRKGTPAYDMVDETPKTEIKKRFNRLLATQKEVQKALQKGE